MSTFAEKFTQALTRSGLSQSEFARRVDASVSSVNQAVKAKHKPRWEKGEVWARELGLTGAEAQDFIETLWLEWSPPPVRQLVSRLRRSSR